MFQQVIIGARCRACRHLLLKDFLSLSSPPPRQRSFVDLCAQKRRLQKGSRWLSTDSQIATRREIPTQEAQESGHAGNADNTQATKRSTKTSHTSDFVPWYLRETAKDQDAQPDKDELPSIPENSPKMMESLIEHVYRILGVDDIRMLDLRDLKPAAPLGANLIMIFGTTRSEKHLHVCADRLCRWARSNHSLSPFADGLLGRNELARKLKRKAKRARLLSSVGAKQTDDGDDGISTGWVCVNMGTVECGIQSGIEGDFSQANERLDGTRIVVQLLTREKREDMDLEGLWQSTLDRSKRRWASLESPSPEEDQKSQGNIGDSASTNSARPTFSIQTSSFASLHPQRREYHSHSASRRATHAAWLNVSAVDGKFEPLVPGPLMKKDVMSKEQLEKLVTEGNRCSIRLFLLDQPYHELSYGERTAMIMRADLNYLKSLPAQDALSVLGEGPEDLSSPFLLSFYQTIPAFPSLDHWQIRTELCCYARQLEHPRFTARYLLQLLDSIEATNSAIPEHFSSMILRTLIFQISGIAPSLSTDPRSKLLPQQNLDHVVKLLDKMESWGHGVLREEVFMEFYEALSVSQNKETNAVREQLVLMMWHLDIHFTTDQNLQRMLKVFAQQENWEAFWDLWAMPARRMVPRSIALYEFMFSMMEQTRSQNLIIQALRNWIPEMVNEEPPVEFKGELASTIMKCLRIASPEAEQRANSGEIPRGEFGRLWMRCEMALAGEA